LDFLNILELEAYRRVNCNPKLFYIKVRLEIITFIQIMSCPLFCCAKKNFN